MKIYSKNQLGIISIIIIGIFYSIYLDNQYYDTIKNGKLYESIVIKQNCHYSRRRMNSSVLIFENNKKYYVKLSHNECQKYPRYSKIKVYYNKRADKFIYKGKNYNGKNRLIFLLTILLVSFLPWSIWISKNETKKR